jgi:hypothetical protein
MRLKSSNSTNEVVRRKPAEELSIEITRQIVPASSNGTVTTRLLPNTRARSLMIRLRQMKKIILSPVVIGCGDDFFSTFPVWSGDCLRTKSLRVCLGQFGYGRSFGVRPEKKLGRNDSGDWAVPGNRGTYNLG